MKILITKAYENRPKYDILLSTLISIFNNHEIDVVESPNDADCHIFIGDCIDDALRGITAGEKTAPIVRVLFRSDLAHNFAIDQSIVDHTIIVKDLDINILCPYRQTTTEINVPFDFTTNGDGVNAPPIEQDIYVNTGEFLYPDSALFKILRTLNRLTRLKIDVCTTNQSIRALANPNISLGDSRGAVEAHVVRSRMVIGSGYAIMYAIKHHKPFIVVGERGYGGIPRR